MAAGSPAPRSCSRASCSSRPTRSILVIKGLSLAVPAMGLALGGGYGGCWRYDAWGRWRNFCYPPYPY